MPTAKQNIQGAYYNGKIYVPGGYMGTHTTENAIYDIWSNTWTTAAPLPSAQTGTTVAFNGKIYVLGGNPGPVSTTRVYDIAADTWTTAAPMPVATTYGRAVVSGNFAYYVGGIAEQTTDAVHRYDLLANTWETMAPLQTARTSEELMASADGRSLYAVMGGDRSVFVGLPLEQTVEVYDIQGNSWSYGEQVVKTEAAPALGYAGGPHKVQGGTKAFLSGDTV
jgi:N-acetylneuraminic acid mutarotase